MKENFYITSPIYYVNDIPHIGHSYTSIACDILARNNRLKGNDVFFLTGVDEHGQKVEKSALARDKSPQEFCDEISQKFSDLATRINISNDDYIRTTQARHKEGAVKFWNILKEKKYIYKGIYEGWYSIRDEAFYNEDEIVDGKAPTGAEVLWHKEESYFFKLSDFQEKLLSFYEANPGFIKPKSKYNEVISFVKSGLKDLSISRTSFSWGIKIPNDENHIMYVWLDALTNYISALDFKDDGEKYKKFWLNSKSIHIVGKDILKFHAIYWPAFLMAAEIKLPHTIFAHGWWTNEGQKISKSVGNVIDPNKEIEWLKQLSISEQTAVDYYRYFLFKEIPFGSDGDYNKSNLITRINSELANNIGNLAQRSFTMIAQNNEGLVVDYASSSESLKLLAQGKEMSKEFVRIIDNFNYEKAIDLVINYAKSCNLYLDQNAPWKLKKENKIAEMNIILSTIAEAVRIIAISLQPIIPHSASKLLDILNIDKNSRFYKNIFDNNLINCKINNPEIIFPRILIK